MKPPTPEDEEARLRSLSAHYVLDTLPEESFDRVARLAAQICRTPIALVSFVDRHRQWFKARVGLDARETHRDLSFCAHAIGEGETLVVEDARQDPRFADSQLVLSSPEIRFYAGAPVRSREGHGLGTLCVIDTEARSLSDSQLEVLGLLARAVETRLELRRVKRANEDLTLMMIHDFHGSLSVAAPLKDAALASPSRRLLETFLTESSQINRMVRDLSELLQAESGSLSVALEPADLRRLFEEIANRAGTRLEDTDHQLKVDLKLPEGGLKTDAALVRRIVENLLENASKYAPAETAIELEAKLSAEGSLVVRVLDEGPGIPEQDRERIFEKYYRLERDQLRPGTGLGLAFCKVATDLLEGHIEANAREPVGVEFRLELPMGKGPASAR